MYRNLHGHFSLAKGTMPALTKSQQCNACIPILQDFYVAEFKTDGSQLSTIMTSDISHVFFVECPSTVPLSPPLIWAQKEGLTEPALFS